MKLNATLKNGRGGKKNTSDNTRILIELTYGNKIVGTIGLYAIEPNKGYRVIWDDIETGGPAKVIKEQMKGYSDCWNCGSIQKEKDIEYLGDEKYSYPNCKGKMQKDTCVHDWDNYGKCCNCGQWNIK